MTIHVPSDSKADMSTDLDSPPVSARPAAKEPAGVRPSARTPAPPSLPGRRNPRWIALGVVAICLGGLLSYVIYARVATATAVVAVAHTVHRGEVVEADDLTTVTLRAGSVPQAIPAAQLGSLVGQRAVFDLPEGAVIPAGAIAPQNQPGSGRTVVGLKLANGRAPSTLLIPGAPVRLIGLAASDGQAQDKLAGSRYLARVITVSPAPDGTSTLLDVDVEAGEAPVIAQLAAADRLVVVRDAEG